MIGDIGGVIGGDARSWREKQEGRRGETSSDAPIFAGSERGGELSVESGHMFSGSPVLRQKKRDLLGRGCSYQEALPVKLSTQQVQNSWPSSS